MSQLFFILNDGGQNQGDTESINNYPFEKITKQDIRNLNICGEEIIIVKSNLFYLLFQSPTLFLSFRSLD